MKDKACIGCKGTKTTDTLIIICSMSNMFKGNICPCVSCIVKPICTKVCDDLQEFMELSSVKFKHKHTEVMIQQ